MLFISGSNNATQGFQQINNLSTSLTSTYCGDASNPYQLTTLSDIFYCNVLSPINAIHHYTWEVTNIDVSPNITTTGTTYGGANNYTSLATLGIFTLNDDKFEIRVKIKFSNSSVMNGLETAWGSECYIQAPANSTTTKLVFNDCNTDATSSVTKAMGVNDYFYCKV